MPKDTFLSIFEQTLDHRSVLRIRYAYRLAKDAHRNQERKDGTRYFEHPREVALISLRNALDPDLVIACLLHDVLEDGNDPLDAGEIELFLGETVIRTVRMVSKVPKEGFHERFSQYADWRAIWVKACDRLHNLRTLPDDPIFRAKQLKETQGVYWPLFEKLPSLVPASYQMGACMLISEIKEHLRGSDV